MMNVLFLVPISKETKIQYRPISQKVKRSQKSRAQFFTALYSNKVMSKITKILWPLGVEARSW